MLGTDTRVVQARGDRVRLDGLAVLVLQQVRVRTLESARGATGECRCMPTGLDAVAGGLVADELDRRVADERVEDADGVRATAHTRDDRIGQAPGRRLHLCTRLETHDALEVAHDHRERVRAGRGAETVVRAVCVGDPVAQRLVDRVLQSGRTRFDGDDLGAEQTHPGDVEGLPGGVDRTHVDDALEPEQGTRGRRRDAVLAGAGLGDDARLAHALGEQHLPQHVVDLVRSGVVQVFPLEQDARAAGVLTQPGRFEDRGRTAGVVALQPVEFVEEVVVRASLLVLRGDLLDHRHERLGYVPTAVDPPVATRVRFMAGPLRQTGAGGRQIATLGHEGLIA